MIYRTEVLRQLGRVSGQLDEGRWAQAETEVYDALAQVDANSAAQMPHRAEVRQNLGRCLYRIGRHEKSLAKRFCSEAIRLVQGESVTTTESPPPPPPSPEAPFMVISSVAGWKGLHWPSRSGAIVETTFQGRRAILMDCLNSDDSPGNESDNPRCQLETQTVARPGDPPLYVRGRFFLPTDGSFPNPVPGWGINITENYAEGTGTSPPWQIQARSNQIETRYLGRSDGLLWGEPLADYMGRWVTYILGLKWGKNVGGWIEMLIEGKDGNMKQAVPNQPIDKIMGGFDGNMRYIIQNYRQYNAISRVKLYHENETVFGRTLASVR